MHLLPWKNSDPASVVLCVLLANDENLRDLFTAGLSGFIFFVCFLLFISLKDNRKLKNIINILMKQLRGF